MVYWFMAGGCLCRRGLWRNYPVYIIDEPSVDCFAVFCALIIRIKYGLS